MAAVDLGAHGGVAHVGVHEIGEVDGRRAPGERDQHALGREAEHLVLEHLELGVLEELFRALRVFENFEQLAHPAVLRQLPSCTARRTRNSRAFLTLCPATMALSVASSLASGEAMPTIAKAARHSCNASDLEMGRWACMASIIWAEIFMTGLSVIMGS